MAGTAVPKKKGRPKKVVSTLDSVVRDSCGRFAMGHEKLPNAGAVKGQIQQGRLDRLMEHVTQLDESLNAKQGDPMDYLRHAITSLAPLETVLQAVGISKRTIIDWKREIEEGTSPRIPYLMQFFDALERQRSDALVDIMLKLREIGFQNGRSWYSLCWLLERTNQEMFVVKREREARPETNVQVNVDISARDALSQAEVAAISYRQQKQIESGG